MATPKKKKPSLGQQLKKAAGKTENEGTVEPIETTSTPTKRPPSRQGKRAICGHYDDEVFKQLKFLAVETDRSIQSLLGEALNELFIKHGKPPIAPK